MSSSNKRIANLPHELTPVTAAEGGAHKTLAVGAAAVGTDSITLADACQHVLVQVETAAVRRTVNGTAPTASLGGRYDAGAELLMGRAEWVETKWIREGGTSALLQVMQYN